MHYYINWALCNLPTFILPGQGVLCTLCLKKRTPYLLYIFILNNSAKNKSILIIYGVQNPKEILHQKLYTYPSHLNKVAALHCESKLVLFTVYNSYWIYVSATVICLILCLMLKNRVCLRWAPCTNLRLRILYLEIMKLSGLLVSDTWVCCLLQLRC